MKLNTFLAVAAVLALVFGVAFLLVPVRVMALYGVALDVSGRFLARYLGSAFVGLAVITWLARNDPGSELKRGVVLAGFVVAVTGLVVALLDALYGPGNALVWSTFAIYLFLAAGYGYFQIMRPAAA